MTIETLWKELEEEASTADPGSWLTRLATGDPLQRLLVAVETATLRRAMLLPVPNEKIPERASWPSCRGLRVAAVDIGGVPHLSVLLEESSYSDVFTALAQDIAFRVAEAAVDAASTIMDRLRRWQTFLAAVGVGLSPEQQKGLFGELKTLRDILIPRLGAMTSVNAWRAPAKTHQDFLFGGGAIEVKTTSAKKPLTVRITSERQLDETGVKSLHLHVVVVDERAADAGHTHVGESLPDVVRTIRESLSKDQSAKDTFEDRLLEVHYLEVDVPRYEGRLYALRSQHTFEVKSGFPRITETSLPDGVGDISYALSVAACGPFEVDLEGMTRLLNRK